MRIHFNINKESLGYSVLALFVPAGTMAQKLPDKPNILIIFTDQQSSESMSTNLGHKYLNTPIIDYLAQHGISFTNAYCANPLSVPSRTSLLTGRYSHETDIQTNIEKEIDPIEFPTIGTIFKSAGYETGYAGKWHAPYDAEDLDSHGFLYMKHIKTNGVDSLLPAAAIDFFKTKRDKPFLFVASFINPHNICEWARGEKLPDGDIGSPPLANDCPPLRPNHEPSKNEADIMQIARASYQAAKRFPVSGFTDDKWRQYIWAYYRMIEKVDAEIGKILAALHESGLDKNTIVVFTSDHGDMQGAHRWNQKTVFFEESSKVPFIISYIGFKPKKSDWLVQTGIDLMPT